MLRANRALPDEARQYMVLLRFATPVPRGALQHFYRIQLTPMMQLGGEGDFYRASVFQPHRAKARKCPSCGVLMSPMGQWQVACGNRACSRWGVLDSTKPSCGVIQVLVPTDLFHPEDKTADGCVLVLDRRYREEVLAAVYRTAGQLCDRLGWRLSQ